MKMKMKKFSKVLALALSVACVASTAGCNTKTPTYTCACCAAHQVGSSSSSSSSSSSASSPEPAEPVLKDSTTLKTAKAFTITDDGLLSKVDISDLDIKRLKEEGYTYYRLELTVSIGKLYGKCVPLVKFYLDRPSKNLNFYNLEGNLPAKYANDSLLFKKELELNRTNTKKIERPIDELLGREKLFIYFVAQGVSTFDQSNNSFSISQCTVTVRCYK